MVPMSSTMAMLSRNSFSDAGTRGPSSPTTPTAKAMSVALGTPQPARPGGVHGGIQGGGHANPADGGDGGQGGRPPRPQFAGDQLALHLEAHHEEEQGHEALVDGVAEVGVELDAPETNAQAGGPQRR